MRNYQQKVELDTPSFLGANTALQFSLIPRTQSPKMQNGFMDEEGDLSKRPGTIPVTTSALGASIDFMTIYKSSPSASAAEEIYAASGTTLHKFNGTTALTGLTMTATLNNADINTIGFTNSALTSRMLIADGAALKQCDGSTVTLVTPAADDALPEPANYLATINTAGIEFIWEYTGHVMVSKGDNRFYYSKRYEFNYFASVWSIILARENDYINGPGVAFDSVCLIPMRRGWGILTGSSKSNFDATNYLNTEYGVIAPRTLTKLTYPDGSQTVVFLSDNGMHEVFVSIIDGGGRSYATKSMMQGKIDFSKIGLTEAEKAAAVGVFHPEKSLYLLSFKKGSENYTYVYDTRTKEWYTDWLTFNAKAYVSLNGTLYFGGSTGHLHKFDEDLYSDWNESTKTTGTPVYFKRYSPAISLEFSGYESFWDAYLLESRQWLIPASLDITFIFAGNTDVMQKIIKNQVMIEDVSLWDVAKYANIDFTDTLNEPGEIIFDYSRLSKYVQVLWENPRDEPVKLFKERWKGRPSGR